MKFTHPALQISEIEEISSEDRNLLFTFHGKFTAEAALQGSRAWLADWNKYPEQFYNLIWDCTDMTGFEISARTEWYNTLKQVKPKVRKVYVVCNNLMIRSAAKVMLEFFRIPSEVVKERRQLPFNLQKLAE